MTEEEDTLPSEPQGGDSERVLDLESLKALAHPLRIQVLDTLSTYGAFTASGLAERLGESSGATSYHIRQLEKHGFVREVPERGTARERWWERTPGSITLTTRMLTQTPTGKAASDLVMQQWQQNRERLLADFVRRGFDELPEEWTDASAITTANLTLTHEQLADLTREVMAVISDYTDRHRGQTTPGTRPVQVQFNAFPVMDGWETPADEPEGPRGS